MTESRMTEQQIESTNNEGGNREIFFVTSNAHKLAEIQSFLSSNSSSSSSSSSATTSSSSTTSSPSSSSSSRVTLKAINLDLPELQSLSSSDITTSKLISAVRLVGSDHRVLVEDTSLVIRGMGGLPGPYIKHFVSSIGLAGLVKLSRDRVFGGECVATCIFGLYSPPPPPPPPGSSIAPNSSSTVTTSKREEIDALSPLDRQRRETENDEWIKSGITLFIGTSNGLIVAPRGSTQFGWDAVFESTEFTPPATGRDSGGGGDGGSERKTFGEMSVDEKNTVSHRRRALVKLLNHLNNSS